MADESKNESKETNDSDKSTIVDIDGAKNYRLSMTVISFVTLIGSILAVAFIIYNMYFSLDGKVQKQEIIVTELKSEFEKYNDKTNDKIDQLENRVRTLEIINDLNEKK